MKILLYVILLLLTLNNVYFSSSLVRHGEINFFNDVARDFLLLQELDEKKIVLIGPRSSTIGLFHGPIWNYINYPAYVVGKGSPIVVGWFWIFLEGIFLLTSFYIARNLFGTFPALIYILLTSTRMASHIGGLFHSEATFFFIPFLFFTIYKYIKSKKGLYLAFHMLALSILIQLNIGIGFQFLILSTLIIFWFIFKNQLWKHLLNFFLLPLFLSNFIIFDLRHDFRMAKAILSTGGALHFFISLQSWVENRFNNIISLQLIEDSTGNNLITFIFFGFILIFTILQIKNKSKYRQTYSLFLFYFFGYMVTSFFNKGILLFHYTYLLVPLTSLWLVSFLANRYKLLFLPIISIVFYFNLNNTNGEINHRLSAMGNYPNSWKGLTTVAQQIIKQQQGKEFGYFVFAPDAFAYQPRYAMSYNFKAAYSKAFEYTKKPTTYIIAAPPPPNDPYMTYVFWRKNQVNISSQPIETKKFPNGFTIEKFYLSKSEQQIAHDKNIELGIHFR